MDMDFFRNWQPTGWFGQDLTLYIIYGAIALAILGVAYGWVKRSSSKPFALKKAAVALVSIIVTGFLGGSFVLFAFNGAGRSVRIEADSKTVLAEQDGQRLAINKMRMIIPNGQSNGISTSVSRFEMIAVDLETGQNAWHRRSVWHESVIGGTKEGILTINTKKKTLFFVDPMTGKTALTEAKWLERYPELEDNLSYTAADYYVASEDELYLYALDGKYYKLDFSLQKVTENPAYKDMLSNAFLLSTSPLALPNDEAWELTQRLDGMYPDLLERTVLVAESDGRNVVVGHLEKRNDKKWSLSLLSLEEPKVLWTTKVDAPKGMNGSDYGAIKAGDTLLFYSNGKLFPVQLETGSMNFTYQYRWNKAFGQ
jgi:hypothetical protein